MRSDEADPGVLGHGVVAADASRALFARVALDSAEVALPAPARLPGLDPDRRYRVRPLPVGGEAPTIADAPPSWWAAGEVVLTGRVLGEIGLPMPLLAPENALLLEVTAV